MDHHRQILFDSAAESQIVCLVLSTAHADEDSFILCKDEDFFVNKLLRQALSSQQRQNLALFALNESNPARPMQLLELGQCTVEAEGSAAFRLRRCADSTLSETDTQALLFRLQTHLCLPQNIVRKAKRPLGDSGSPCSEPKRQQVDTEVPPAIPEPIAEPAAVPTKPVQVLAKPDEVPAKPLQVPDDTPWRQTAWNGTLYRSKLEAQTACFMQYAGVDFRYEKVQLLAGTSGGMYTPDFWLPKQQIFIEVKPAYPHIDELAKCEAVAANGFTIVLMYGRVGPPMGFENAGLKYSRTYQHSDNCRGIAWSGLTGQRLPGDWMWLWDEASGSAVLGPLRDSRDARWNHEKLKLAYECAHHSAFGPQ